MGENLIILLRLNQSALTVSPGVAVGAGPRAGLPRAARAPAPGRPALQRARAAAARAALLRAQDVLRPWL